MDAPQLKPPIDREARFIADLLIDAELERLDSCRNLPPEAFESFDHRKTWKRLREAKTFQEVESIALRYAVVPTDGMSFLEDRKLLWLKAFAVLGESEWLRLVKSMPSAGPSPAALAEMVAARRFNYTATLTKPEPRFMVQGKGVATSGNVSNIIAQAKSGKSAFMGAWLAAAIVAESGEQADTLGVTSIPPAGRILLHIDTEQSLYDADNHIRRALTRASAEVSPAWLWSFHLAGFSPDQIRAALNLLLPQAEAAGGVFAVIVDGIADLVDDVNNPDACNPFVAEVQGMAIRYDCPIITVIHENPTQDTGKARGHLGSQLIRKAESNLRLKKTEGVTVVFAEDLQRGVPILQKDGPAFQWDDAQQMHVSTIKKDPQVEELRSLAKEVFTGNPLLAYSEAVKAIRTAGDYAAKTGEKKFTAIKKAGLIRDAGAGKWMLAA
jgi:hypothetical protein